MSHLAERLTNGVEFEDVLQESLAVAWRKRRQFDPSRGSARNWLLALTADQARKSWRRSQQRSRAIALSPAEPFVSATAEGDRLDMERALYALTGRQRVAVVLYYYLGLPVSDIAAVMSCGESTTKSTLADARRKLRAELGEDYR